MFFYLILLFTVIPALELALLIKVGQIIGVANTLFFIIFTGVLGAYLARHQGFQVLQKIQDNMNQGIMPTEEMFDGLMIFCGGIVLLTPGFITDALGFILLIPLTRQIIKYFLQKKIKSMMSTGQITTRSSFSDRDDIDDADYY